MTLLPAIDLLGGQVVRLRQGKYNEVSVYSDDPEELAADFFEKGARRLHLVDLDAARGQGRNRDALARIRKAFPGTIQAGGGIRSHHDAAELIDLGMDRLVLGTVLVTNPNLAEKMIRQHGRVFLAGIDAYDGEVRVNGWEEVTHLTDKDLGRSARDLGCLAIIYTNIRCDGTLEGPDLERTLAIGAVSDLPVVLSGGVSSPSDIARAATLSRGPVGVVLGKALYAGCVDLMALTTLYPQPESFEW